MPQPQVGDTAPEFSLTSGSGASVKLRQFRGKQNVVLYFYPRDNTPGCTQEACDFRDQSQVLTKADTVVLGVSPDTTASHALGSITDERSDEVLAST